MTLDSARTRSQTRQLAKQYSEAWNTHDVEGLLSLQTHDMVFHLHLEGSGPTSGVEELRALYSFFFRAMPDYHSDITREVVGGEAIVWEYTITATLVTDFPIGEASGKPNGETVTVDAVDVITCAQDKVLSKHTYVDGIALLRGMEL